MRALVIALLFLLVAVSVVSAGGLSVEAVAYPDGEFNGIGVPAEVVVIVNGPSEGILQVTLLEDGHAVAEKEVGADPSGGTVILLWEGLVSWGDDLRVRVRHISRGGISEAEIPVNMERVEEILSRYPPAPTKYLIPIVLLSFATFPLAALIARRGHHEDALIPLSLPFFTLFVLTGHLAGSVLLGHPGKLYFLVASSIGIPAMTALYALKKKESLSLTIPVALQGAILLAAVWVAQSYVIPVYPFTILYLGLAVLVILETVALSDP